MLSPAEQAFDDKKKEFGKLITKLKDRDTKENIANLKEEFEYIHGEMTGKKKVVSMYQIQRNMNRENETLEGEKIFGLMHTSQMEAKKVPLKPKSE